MKKYQNLMLAFLVGVLAFGMVGCENGTPFIQVNLGPAAVGGMVRRGPVVRPQVMEASIGGYPAAGGDGGYYGGYQPPYGQPYVYGYGGQPSYGYGGGCRQLYMSGNMLMRYGQWIPQWELRQRQYFMPRYPNGFMRGGGCHRPPPPHSRHHR